VGLYISDDFAFVIRDDLNAVDSCRVESVFIELVQERVIIGSVYRPQDQILVY